MFISDLKVGSIIVELSSTPIMVSGCLIGRLRAMRQTARADNLSTCYRKKQIDVRF